MPDGFVLDPVFDKPLNEQPDKRLMNRCIFVRIIMVAKIMHEGFPGKMPEAGQAFWLVKQELVGILTAIKPLGTFQYAVFIAEGVPKRLLVFIH